MQQQKDCNNNIVVKGIIDEDFVNYKVPSMSIIFPYCTFKCGENNCQNYELYKEKNISVNINYLCERYINNPITSAMVFQGLEPFDSFDEMYKLIKTIRNINNDDIVIYTGYNKEEISYLVDKLKDYKNIIIKFGRFIPNEEKHYDEILGVYLSSLNQYSEKIS